MTNARAAREAARDWISSNRARWPDLRAAHLVGSITTLPDDAPFPSAKDIDLHLIFDVDSPMLAPQGPFLSIVEEQAQDWPIEAGIKSVVEYASPEVVLANPEIAHHLTVDSILLDPEGLLASLQGPVYANYAKRRWLTARLNHERRALAEARALWPMAVEYFGVTGGVNLLGYMMTFPTAAFGIAALGPPRAGSRALVHLRAALVSCERLDLYEELLRVLGVAQASPAEARAWVLTAASLFDRAVPVRRIPHPFQHKLHAHLRPYFVSACLGMIDAGDHREGLAWSVPFHLASLDVLRVDGSDGDKDDAARGQQAFLAFLGFPSMAVLEARLERALPLYEAMFDLADAIAFVNSATIG